MVIITQIKIKTPKEIRIIRIISIIILIIKNEQRP